MIETDTDDSMRSDAERYRLLRELTHSVTGKGPRVVMNIYRGDGSFVVPGSDAVSEITLDQAMDELLAAQRLPPNTRI